jgi:hypothetical protein
VDADVVRDQLSGRLVRPVELASRQGELIRLADVDDPYTGARGRDAIMVNGSLQGEAAQIALDDDRGSFEALMARLDVVQGSKVVPQ